MGKEMEPTQPTSDSLRWALLVPMKPPATAKSRLAVVPASLRAELVLAMACDTVAVAIACPRVELVLIVADDADGLEPLRGLGASVVVDPAGEGLNAALRYAAGVAAARNSGYGIASLVADVPAVTVDQLTRVLDVAAKHSHCFVRDAAGRGTTMVTAQRWAAFLPEYGHQSRRRHREAGFIELDEPDIAGLRHDVDTVADLMAVAALGTGPMTNALLGQWSERLE
jgi:2-phospho-L-lactate/phosphoenolpyruvate guanylyltransferase